MMTSLWKFAAPVTCVAVHVASWRTTYKGIFPDTLLDSLSVDKREQSWRETLALPEPNSVTLVACNVDGSIVGFISGGAERTGRLGYEGELYAIYLLQLVQRQGLGTVLVRHFVRELRARGFGSMAVWVLAANPFRKFYEAVGGKVVAEQQIETWRPIVHRRRLRLARSEYVQRY